MDTTLVLHSMASKRHRRCHVWSLPRWRQDATAATATDIALLAPVVTGLAARATPAVLAYPAASTAFCSTRSTEVYYVIPHILQTGRTRCRDNRHPLFLCIQRFNFLPPTTSSYLVYPNFEPNFLENEDFKNDPQHKSYCVYMKSQSIPILLGFRNSCSF